jgi:hypothetical protein
MYPDVEQSIQENIMPRRRKDQSDGFIGVRRPMTYPPTGAEWRQMYIEQDGRCLLCGEKFDGINCAVDHDHDTGKIRGMLCVGCNTMMGYYDKRKEFSLKATEYAKRGIWDESDVSGVDQGEGKD